MLTCERKKVLVLMGAQIKMSAVSSAAASHYSRLALAAPEVRLSFSALNSAGSYPPPHIHSVQKFMLLTESWYKFDTKKQRAGEVQCSEEKGVSRSLKIEFLGHMEQNSSDLSWPWFA